MMPFDTLSLKTQRLLLRPLKAEDAKPLFEVFSDPEVMRFWSTPPWTTIEQAQEMIAADTEELARGIHLRLGIVTPGDEALIGTCSLFNFSQPSRRAEIGYCLASSAWGRGYMYEALTELIRYAFDELKLHRLEADIDPRNSASERILLRLGFVKEGHLRARWIVDDETSDSALYGLLQSDRSDRAVE